MGDISTEEQQYTLEFTLGEHMDPKIAVVDGMNLVQKLTTKMTAVQTVKDSSVFSTKAYLILPKILMK